MRLTRKTTNDEGLRISGQKQIVFGNTAFSPLVEDVSFRTIHHEYRRLCFGAIYGIVFSLRKRSRRSSTSDTATCKCLEPENSHITSAAMRVPMVDEHTSVDKTITRKEHRPPKHA